MDNQPHAEKAPAVKLSGIITAYSKRRQHASFVLTESDHAIMGVIAICASIAGLSGQAASTAANAADVEEGADYVQFTLAGYPVQGWLWRSPFKNGDQVDAAVEWQGDHYELFGLARPSDRMIALYPHCSRGRKRHIRNVFFWWVWLGLIAPCVGMMLTMCSIMGMEAFEMRYLYISFLFLGTFFGAMFASLGRQWMPFVGVAEKIFATLDLPAPSNIDLVESAKGQRRDDDTGEYGTFYFRY